jgi:hypothetical protein
MALNDSTLRTIKPSKNPVKLFDGGGLYLYVQPNGSKLWRMTYRYDGKQKTLSFGPYPLVSLREARDKRDEAKKLLLDDIDPMTQKKEVKEARRAVEKDERETFAFVAREWFETYKTRLTPKHAKKLHDWLETRLFPEIGKIPVTQIEPQQLLDAVRLYER